MKANSISNPKKRTGLLFNCERCGEPIEIAAALLFSPPSGDIVRKHHLCGNCYQSIAQNFVNSKSDDSK